MEERDQDWEIVEDLVLRINCWMVELMMMISILRTCQKEFFILMCLEPGTCPRLT